ncbi:hypothetical protein DYH55_05570 [Methylovirgula sp. 4M-Z18]|nr:hypothetical protein DYH55_05570 [Methylovirgula sp. 4M-Z18]
MQCDTRLMLTEIPEDLQKAHSLGPEAQVVFAQAESGLYRDGLRLPSGQFVSLQALRPGIGAYVTHLLEHAAEERVTTKVSALS